LIPPWEREFTLAQRSDGRYKKSGDVISMEPPAKVGDSAHLLNYFRSLFSEAFAPLISPQFGRRVATRDRQHSKNFARRLSYWIDFEQVQTRKDWIVVDNSIFLLPLKNAVAQRKFD